MGKLIYSAIASADGYIEDAAGSGGAGLAGQAIKAGLVDELQLFLVRSSWEAASEPSPTASVPIWSCWTRSGSQAVPSTSGTGSRQRDHLARQLGIAWPGRAGRPGRATRARGSWAHRPR